MPHASTMTSMTSNPSSPHHTGGELVSTQGLVLPLERTHLACQAQGGVARVTLEQRFRNPHDQPLLVTYKLPLPADGAVSGFSFRIGETRIVGEVDRRESARERFEHAIAAGQTAAILDQERSSVFTQEVGNIPPGQEIVCEVEIDQPLTWLPEGSWEWRFPTVVGARYMGAQGRVRDADAVSVSVADSDLPARLTLALGIGDALADDAQPASPSHALRSVLRGGSHEVCFKNDRTVRLDRDVVVRWTVARPEVGVSLDTVRPASDALSDNAYGLLTVVPPDAKGDAARTVGRKRSADRTSSSITPLPRDLVFLIDTSGSMGGRPLDQAKRVVCAMIDTLRDRDRIELIEFGSRPVRWRKEPTAATRDGRRQAMKWVKSLRTSGATEMHAAVLEALRPLRPECQRQVVLITDGYIGFEHEIIETVMADLPKNCRLHTIGVGSAPNRSLTGPAARVGNGVELVIGIDEDAERVAERLLARTTAPLVTDLVISGDAVVGTAPMRLPDLFAGSPALISLALDPRGGEVRVTGTMAGGEFEQVVTAPARILGEGNQAIATLYGRERVEDLETRCKTRGNTSDIDREIEQIGLDFQIATRLTSWVAIHDEVVVDPGDELIRETMPQEIPHGASIEGFGLRSSAAGLARQSSVLFSLSEVSEFDDEAPLDAEMQRIAPSLAGFSADKTPAPSKRRLRRSAGKDRDMKPRLGMKQDAAKTMMVGTRAPSGPMAPGAASAPSEEGGAVFSAGAPSPYLPTSMSAEFAQARKRRSLVGAILVLLVLIAVIALGIWFGLGFFTGDDSGAGEPSGSGDRIEQPAPAAPGSPTR